MSRHGTALDTLRWGDSQLIQITGTTGFAAVAVSSMRQIAQARWRWPLSWKLRIVITAQQLAAETSDFTITVQVTFGSGQNSSTVTFTYPWVQTAGAYPVCVTDVQEIPAQDVQVTAKVTGASPAADVTSNFYVGCFLAPTTEPHAMTALMEHLVEGDEQGARWMTEHHPHDPNRQTPGTGQGFPINPDPLTYQPRR